MCAIFGLIDYENIFNLRQREQILRVLSVECEERGIDATGYAFNESGKLKIVKKPVPAHELRLRMNDESNVILGHTRMATQGDQKFNYNNHPFYGKADETNFALAHNGIIYNDEILRKELNLPVSKIETDSYIAVQMLEKFGELSEKSLAEMAEKINGSFVFTLLDEWNNSYFVRGDNPLALYKFKAGFYIYASTEGILKSALKGLGLAKYPHEKIETECGDILKIDSEGELTRSKFQPPIEEIYSRIYPDFEYVEMMSSWYGIPEEYIELMLDYGYTLGDIDDLCGIPEAVEGAVSEILCEYGYCGE